MFLQNSERIRKQGRKNMLEKSQKWMQFEIKDNLMGIVQDGITP